MPLLNGDDHLERWTSLMDEWATVSKELDAVMELAESIEPAARSQWQQRLDEVRQHQDAVKQQIDEIISGATAARTAPVDALIVGQISNTPPPATVDLFHQTKNRS